MGWKNSFYNVFFPAAEGLHVGYNSLSGQFLEFDDASYSMAQEFLNPDSAQTFSEQTGFEQDRVRKALIKAGFLIPLEVDELGLLEKRNHSSSTSNNVSLTIALTQDCNFACSYCFEDHLPGTLTEPVKNRVLNFIENRTRDAKSLAIDWYGGEPLLEFDLLKTMDRAAGDICARNQCAYQSSISTNGYLLAPHWVDELIMETSVRTVRICLDGPPEIHDQRRPLNDGGRTFDVILRNLRRAVERLTVKLRINADKENWQSIGALLSLVTERGISGPNLVIALKPTVPTRRSSGINLAFTPQEFSQVEPGLMREVLDRGFKLDSKAARIGAHCIVLQKNQFMIDWRGFLYKCSDTFRPDEAVGTITALGEAELDPDRLAPWLTFPAPLDEQCRRCRALPLCMGGCGFRRLVLHSHWCGAERFNLREYAQIYYKQYKLCAISH